MNHLAEMLLVNPHSHVLISHVDRQIGASLITLKTITTKLGRHVIKSERDLIPMRDFMLN